MIFAIARTRLIKNRAAALWFVLLCVMTMSTIGAQEIEEGRRLLNEFADNVQTMSARFEQSLVDVNDEVIETSSGTVDIQRPGRFRWAYAEPYEQILIADGRNVWSYDVDLAQVTVKSQEKVLSNTPALLLGGSDRVLDDFDYIGSFEDRGTIWVQLKPKNTDNGFSKVELGFSEGTLSRMVFGDTLEQTTFIALLDVSINAHIADDLFKFEPPADVDVVGVPATLAESSKADM